MAEYRERVYEVVATIPAGKVATYATVAFLAGEPRNVRMVGRYLHVNPDPDHIPCYRVVFADGHLPAEYTFGGAAVQRALLEREGVTFDSWGRVNREHFIKI